jgi:hypothetical protein
MIFVGPVALQFGNELVAGYQGHRLEHSFVVQSASPKLLVHHAPARGGKAIELDFGGHQGMG